MLYWSVVRHASEDAACSLCPSTAKGFTQATIGIRFRIGNWRLGLARRGHPLIYAPLEDR